MIKQGSKLLLDEYPLMVLPQLATKIGLNEAIVLQQVNYWLTQSGKEREGRVWIYNTYEDWQRQFPFYSLSTIRRTIKRLENLGLLITGNYNKLKIDQTKWYTIDFELLNSRYVQNEQACNFPTVQNEQTNSSNCNSQLFKMNRPIPEITPETSSKNIKNKASSTGDDGMFSVDNFSEDAKSVYRYFMEQYLDFVGEMHPVINKQTVDKLNEIIESSSIYDVDYGKELYIDSEALIEMIDLYFKTEYPLQAGGYADHRIYHFLSDGVLKNLYYKAVY